MAATAAAVGEIKPRDAIDGNATNGWVTVDHGGSHRMAYVRWIDSGMHSDYGWAPAEKYIENADLHRMECVTVGIIMHEDEDIIVVALSHDPAHDKWISAQLIHKQSIQDLLYLGWAC
jgi:hypothetical protein